MAAAKKRRYRMAAWRIAWLASGSVKYQQQRAW